MKLNQLFTILTFFSSLYFFAQQKTINIPDNIKAIENIDYATFGNRKVQLDLYTPKAKGIYPGIILVHGGGWIHGTRKGFSQLAIDLAQHGYVVANIDYRLATEAKFPGAVQDTKAAIRWLRANAKKHGVNPDKIAGIGSSAGGHLIAMAALTGHRSKFNGKGNNSNISSKLQAAIIMGTGVDQVTRVKNAPNQYVKSCFIFFGGSYADKAKVYAQGSPITHITRKSPPILMLDGEKDKPGERYIDFRKILDKKSIINAFEVIPEAKHGDWNKDKFRPIYAETCIKFLEKHL